MVHRVSQKKLSRNTSQRKALLKNLANDLILRERIVTTKAKAKTVQPFVERLITRSKNNSITNRRILISKLGRENSVRKLLEIVGPIFKDKPGGYTRVVKLFPRVGDRSSMAIVEFSENISEKAAKAKLEKVRSEAIEKSKTSSKSIKSVSDSVKSREKKVSQKKLTTKKSNKNTKIQKTAKE